MAPTRTGTMSKAATTASLSTENTASIFVSKSGASLETLAARKSLDRMAESQKQAQRRVMAGWSQKPERETIFAVPDSLMYHATALSPNSIFRLNNATNTASFSPTETARTSLREICPNYPNEPPLNPLQRLRREWASSPQGFAGESGERTQALMAALDQMVEKGKERQRRVMKGWERKATEKDKKKW